jgi:hypothetical protein
MVTGAKAESPATSLLQRTIVKWTALYLPLSWPPEIPTRPGGRSDVGGTRPNDFAADVAKLVALVELVTTPGGVHWQSDPVFGRMSETARLRWGISIWITICVSLVCR